MSYNHSRPGFTIFFACLVCLLTLWYLSISLHYPYYFSFDMDLFTTLDTLLIHSGLLPDQLTHGFGMNLLLVLTQKIAYMTRTLSILTLHDLDTSLNPLSAIAEYTTFIRLHSPAVAIAIVLCLWAGFVRIFRPSPLQALLILMILGTQESFVYHSTLIRSEFYSVFYWSLAILLMPIIVETTHRTLRFCLLWLSGIFLGLCYTTKVQAIMYVIFALLLFLLLESFHQQDLQNIRACEISPRIIWSIININILVFTIFLIAAYFTPLPKGVETFAIRYRINSFTILSSLIIIIGLPAMQFFITQRKAASPLLYQWSSSVHFFLAGGLASFLLHFALYRNMNLGMKHLLYDFRIIFFREMRLSTSIGTSLTSSDYITKCRLLLSHFQVPIFSLGALVVILILGCHYKCFTVTLRQVSAYLSLSIIAGVNMVFGIRLTARDLLWVEVLVTFLILFYLLVILSNVRKYQRLCAILSYIGLGIIVWTNIGHTRQIMARIDVEYGRAWDPDAWLVSPFHRNVHQYGKIMRRHYDIQPLTPPSNTYFISSMAEEAKKSAIRHHEIRNVVNDVFKNQRITHQNIGILSEGFPVWKTALEYRIHKLDDALRGAILIDSASESLDEQTFFWKWHVQRNKSATLQFDIINPAGNPGHLSILSREGVHILLFLQSEDLPVIWDAQVMQNAPYHITITKGHEVLQFSSVHIYDYCELPVNNMKHRYFFVIQTVDHSPHIYTYPYSGLGDQLIP